MSLKHRFGSVYKLMESHCIHACFFLSFWLRTTLGKCDLKLQLSTLQRKARSFDIGQRLDIFNYQRKNLPFFCYQHKNLHFYVHLHFYSSQRRNLPFYIKLRSLPLVVKRSYLSRDTCVLSSYMDIYCSGFMLCQVKIIFFQI